MIKLGYNKIHSLSHLPGGNCFQDRKIWKRNYSVISLLLAGGPGGFNLREGIHDVLQRFGDSLETISKACVCRVLGGVGGKDHSLAHRRHSLNIPSKNSEGSVLLSVLQRNRTIRMYRYRNLF